MKRTRYLLPLFFGGLLLSCNNPTTPDGSAKPADTATAAPPKTAAYPEKREKVNPEPVAVYKVKTENPLNDWYFKVTLQETPNAFHYLLKMQYEEIRGEDTLKLPNFGIEPVPEIRKGSDPYSCIIGFLDKDKKFREYKKVYVKDNVLKVTTLKHYAVYAWKKEVEEK